MNILLDAFYDLNYGDDLFVETMTGLFPKCKFYSFLEYYPPKVIEKAQKIANLYLLPECNVFLKKNMFDAYICVGGDIFPDGGDYTKRKAYVRSVKQSNGVVVFWGFNLFHNYCEQTKKDIVELMADADVIAPRDEKSAQILRQLMPGKEIFAIADLAFLSDWKHCGSDGEILGISIRRPNYATDDNMKQYTAKLQGVIDSYLKEHDHRRVKIFSLSSGSTSDEAVAQEIIDGVAAKDRVEHVVYTGDTASIKQAISKCSVMICTRLHAMISCIALQVPFLPIVYEVKMDHILQEIGYKGNVVRFQEIGNTAIDLDGVVDAFRADRLWDKRAERKYIDHTEEILRKLRGLLRHDSLRENISKEETSGPVCEEKENISSTLQAALNQRNIDVKTLETALNQRAADVATLEAALNQRAADVATLEAALNQRAADVATLEAALNQRATDVATLESALNQRVKDIAALENTVNQQTAQIALLEAELNEIKSTWQYRATEKMRHMIHRP